MSEFDSSAGEEQSPEEVTKGNSEESAKLLGQPSEEAASPAGSSSARKAPSVRTTKRATSGARKKSASRKAGKRAAIPKPVPKYPRHSLEKALRVPRGIYEQNAGKPATKEEAVRFAGGAGLNGPWSVELSSAKKYGFLVDDDGRVALTDRARRALAPQSDSDRLTSLQEAIQDAPDFSAVYNFYRGEYLPEAQYFTNALLERFKIPSDKLGEFQQLFDESLRYAELIDDSGPRVRVLDVGRPSGRGASKSMIGTIRPVPGDAASCFVMQPFSGWHGSYYENIFKPAIEQAGLQAIRADADIFATGKIIDQIWRGINSASVLVAELTTKNPNVFYELGIAHALHKPVVLVSSNEDDIPFDLRHIRVIVYERSDPFWGQKLIDKVADNIRSAMSNPEDAIFKIEQGV